MRVKPKSNDYYKKYRYLIWRDDIGFLHLETFSSEELLKFSKNINDQLKNLTYSIAKSINFNTLAKKIKIFKTVRIKLIKKEKDLKKSGLNNTAKM